MSKLMNARNPIEDRMKQKQQEQAEVVEKEIPKAEPAKPAKPAKRTVTVIEDEVKSIKVNLLVTPTLRKKLEAKAKKDNRSINFIATEILEAGL